MLKLVVNSQENSQAVIPVRWCLDQEAIYRLAELGAADAHIVISVANDGREMDRVMAPIGQALAYVEFRKPGINTLNAFIAWDDNGRTGRLKDYFLRQTGRMNFTHKIYNYDDVFWPGFCDMWRNSLSWLSSVEEGDENIANLDVNVPAEFFASEPPEWEKRWVNFWHRYQPVNQCDYRRRRIWAYTIKPFVALAYATASIAMRVLVALFTLLMGLRVASYGAVVRPFDKEIRDVWDHWDVGGYFDRNHSYILTNERAEPRPFGFSLLHPLNFLILAIILYIGSLLSADDAYAFAAVLLLGALVAATTLILGVLSHYTRKFIKPLVGKLEVLRKIKGLVKQENSPDSKAREKARIERENHDREARIIAYQQQLSELACDTIPMEVDVRALRRPSVSLRFRALKAKVCRPYYTD